MTALNTSPRSLLGGLALILALVSWLGPSGALASDGLGIYWTEFNGNRLMRADLDGSDPETLLTGASGAAALAVDSRNRSVAWSSFQGILHRYSMCDKVDTAIGPLLQIQERILIDSDNGFLYATGSNDPFHRGVFRADLDGTNITQLFDTELTSTRGIAGDFDAGHIYWGSDDGTVRRVDVDGNNPVLLVSGAGSVNGVAVDTVNGHLYYARTDGQGGITRTDLNGANPQVLVTGELAKTFSIQLDIAGNSMYWQQSSQGKIYQADLDGSNPVAILDGLSSPISVGLQLGYRQGNVNGGAGRVTDTLFINGSAGSGNGVKTVEVGVGEAFSIRLDAAPAGPFTDAAYALLLWPGESVNPLPLDVGSSVIGTLANPTPLHPFSQPQPQIGLRGGIPSVFLHGVTELASPAGAPWLVTKANGFSRPVSYVLQAVLQDSGSCGEDGFSATNTVVLRIQ